MLIVIKELSQLIGLLSLGANEFARTDRRAMDGYLQNWTLFTSKTEPEPVVEHPAGHGLELDVQDVVAAIAPLSLSRFQIDREDGICLLVHRVAAPP